MKFASHSFIYAAKFSDFRLVEKDREKEKGDLIIKALKSLSTAATWKAKLSSHFQRKLAS